MAGRKNEKGRKGEPDTHIARERGRSKGGRGREKLSYEYHYTACLDSLGEGGACKHLVGNVSVTGRCKMVQSTQKDLTCGRDSIPLSYDDSRKADAK